MKILIVSPYISTTKDLRLYQSQQLNLALELTKLDVEVSILCGKRFDGEKKHEIIDGINVYRLNTLSGIFEKYFNQVIMLGLWKKLKKLDFDIIQTSDDSAFSSLITAVFSIIYKKKLVLYQGLYKYSSKFVIRILMKVWDFNAGKIIRKATTIAICKTKKASRFLEKKKYRSVKVIPIGVNTSIFYKNNSTKNHDFINLLAVGDLIVRKNYQLILKSFKNIVKKNSNAQLTIIGKGPEKNNLHNYIVENSLSKNVTLLDNIPNDKMIDFYNNADFLLLFSRDEIFGMVILEAMACGCPVIATQIPGAIDIIKNKKNGYLISDKDSPQIIADKILSLIKISNIDREKLAKETAEKYSWETIGERYYRLYLNILN